MLMHLKSIRLVCSAMTLRSGPVEGSRLTSSLTGSPPFQSRARHMEPTMLDAGWRAAMCTRWMLRHGSREMAGECQIKIVAAKQYERGRLLRGTRMLGFGGAILSCHGSGGARI